MWANNQYGGPDYQKIYAYLRYLTDEAMLVIINFDQNPQGFLFKIPEHAWSEMFVSRQQVVQLQPVFGIAPSLSFDARLMAESGFWINISPSSGIIYKLRWK